MGHCCLAAPRAQLGRSWSSVRLLPPALRGKRSSLHIFRLAQQDPLCRKVWKRNLFPLSSCLGRQGRSCALPSIALKSAGYGVRQGREKLPLAPCLGTCRWPDLAYRSLQINRWYLRIYLTIKWEGIPTPVNEWLPNAAPTCSHNRPQLNY